MSANITSMLNLSSTMHYNKPPVVLTQADVDKGIEDLWQALKDHQSQLCDSGLLETRRAHRRRSEPYSEAMAVLEGVLLTLDIQGVRK